jgi:hypothetical protein
MSQYFEQDFKAMGDKRFHRSSMIHDSKLLYNLSYGTNGITCKATELQSTNTNDIKRPINHRGCHDKGTSIINSQYLHVSKVKDYEK